ncbi:MAG TPA: ABC transporter permease [Actinomycetota bacterium]|nr:ABC transporter permease [Actinomycetota bacterium]
MRDLVAAELKKLTSTRWIYLLAVGVVGLSVVSVLDPGRDAAMFEKPFHEQTFVLFASLLTRVLVFVMGVRVMTDELRHGTIVPTLLVTPRRNRVLAAKVVAAAGAGAVLALTGWAAMTAAAGAAASSEGTSLALDASLWRSLAGTLGAGAAWGVIGVGVGTVVRSQVAATVGGLVWLMALEDGVKSWLGDLGGYLPGQAGLAVAMGLPGRALAIAGTTLAAYATASFAASRVAIRRDVT